MTDYFTKWVDMFPLATKEVKGVCAAIKTFISRWGPPGRILSDQGREFVNQLNRELCSLYGIQRSVTSAYHPQCNGLDERTNQTVKTRLSKLVTQHGIAWDTLLEDVAYSIRTQRQESTKLSPYFLMFGRIPRQVLQMGVAAKDEEMGDAVEVEAIPVASEADICARVDRLKHHTDVVYQTVKENQNLAHQKQQEVFKKRASKGVKSFDLKAGDCVLRKNMRDASRKGGAMNPLWTGPYRIVDIDDQQRAQLIKDGDKEPLKARVAYSQVKPMKEREPILCATSEKTVSSVSSLPSVSSLFVSTAPSASCPTPTTSKKLTKKQKQSVSVSSVQVSTSCSSNADVFITEVRGTKRRRAEPLDMEKTCKLPRKSVAMEDTLKRKQCLEDSFSALSVEERDTILRATSETTVPSVSLSVPSSPPAVSVSLSAATSASYAFPAIDNDVYITEVCGPRRRRAEPLDTKKACKQTNMGVRGDMKDILRRKRSLEDPHIDHFSALLQDEFPDIDGFQSCSVFQAGHNYFVGTPTGTFVQILNLNYNHWITVSNMHCTFPGQVKIYDSIYTAFPTTTSRRDIMEQIAWILHTDTKEITVEWHDVQHQTGNKACGMYAISNAYALCAGLNPENYAWDQKNLWAHIMKCLDNDRLTLSPVSGTRSGRGVVGNDRETVYCVCRQPALRKRFMIECPTCKEWFHRRCQDLPYGINESTIFVCSRCST